MSSAETVRKLALATILQLCKQNATALKKHSPVLVPILLESLSAFENQQINYLSFHVEKYDISKDQLDSSRSAAVRASPITQSIELCISNCDDRKALVDSIHSSVKKAIGLPWKIGTAQAISLCAVSWTHEILPYSDQLLKAARVGLKDQNLAVKTAYARSIAQVLRHSDFSIVEKIIGDIVKTYSQVADDSSDKLVLPAMVKEMSSVSRDAMDKARHLFVPHIYFGLDDEDKNIAQKFRDAWEEIAPSQAACVRSSFHEIMDVLLQRLQEDSSWTTKKRVGSSISRMLEIINKKADFSVDEVKVKGYGTLLLDALSGRTWEGKEMVLKGTLDLISTFSASFQRDEEWMRQLSVILLRECKKNNIDYKKAVVQSVATFVNETKIDMYLDLKPIVLELYTQRDLDMDMDNEEDRVKEKKQREETDQVSMKALGQIWHSNRSGQLFPFCWSQLIYLDQELLDLVEVMHTFSESALAWTVRKALLDSLNTVCEKSEPISNTKVLEKIIRICLIGLGDLKVCSFTRFIRFINL